MALCSRKCAGSTLAPAAGNASGCDRLQSTWGHHHGVSATWRSALRCDTAATFLLAFAERGWGGKSHLRQIGKAQARHVGSAVVLGRCLLLKQRLELLQTRHHLGGKHLAVSAVACLVVLEVFVFRDRVQDQRGVLEQLLILFVRLVRVSVLHGLRARGARSVQGSIALRCAERAEVRPAHSKCK